MATPSEKLADSLAALRELQDQGAVAIRSATMTRTHRERLIRNGFLQEVMRGWYIPVRPDDHPGDSTAWYASFWDFCAAYLNHRKGDEWCLSPEASIALHTGNTTVPKQLLVRAAKPRKNVTKLPHDTSILEIGGKLPAPDRVTVKNGLRLYSLPAALVASRKHIFTQNPITDIRVAMASVADASDILRLLLEGGHSTTAGYLAGAFRNIGRDRIADEIIGAMRTAGYDARESDPFKIRPVWTFSSRAPSPYVTRIRMLWKEMRGDILDCFPEPPGPVADRAAYMRHVDDIYAHDAYHSLSIEGYRVSLEIIDRVRSGDWDPEGNEEDRESRDALAARGYYQAHRLVRGSVERILEGKAPGVIADQEHQNWYREMFAPVLAAGIVKPADLAGYRNSPVYIRHARHVPPGAEAARDAMPAFFELLQEEESAAVRVVLGHFVFVYIHPYLDGNGRMGRFLMNAMLAGGGYPWTIVTVERRKQYMAALEEASTGEGIKPFARFLGSLVEQPEPFASYA